MTDLDRPDAPAADAQLSALRARIGWICHLLRLLVVGYVLWLFGVLLYYWTDRAWIERQFSDALKLDISGASQTQFGAALAFNLFVWVLLAVMCFCLWRVLGLYLEGRIFTVEAALWLRRAGMLGLATTIADFASRSLIIMTLEAHLPSTAGYHHGFISSSDPLHLIFALLVIAFAHIFKTAAEIAGEHAQFV
ncbi:MAG: DUF2975 domain-containing protein [Methylocystis sp.]|nr:DUF2975 domain-containing protein [Methylocystis sp.]MBI3274966.1 DUF2975 domain-containing protein [Methylocystis sp.]